MLLLRWSFSAVLVAYFCVESAVVAQVDPSRGGPVSANNFESRYELNSATKDNLQWVKDPAGSGKTVLFARVRDTDGDSAGAKRTEISPTHEHIKEGIRWYAFSFYLPDDWQFHPFDTVVAQLHTSQKTAIVSPPVVFVILGSNLVLSRHRPTDLSLPVSKANTTTNNTLISTVATNKWYCLVVRVDWSNTYNKGSLEVWLNGNQVFKERNYHNSFETWLGNYPKAGIYMPGLMGVSKREVYMDFIHLGDAQSRFKDMYALTPCDTK